MLGRGGQSRRQREEREREQLKKDANITERLSSIHKGNDRRWRRETGDEFGERLYGDALKNEQHLHDLRRGARARAAALCKAAGARVIGVAGGARKAAFLVDTLKLHGA
eukprot:gene15326-5563_t